METLFDDQVLKAPESARDFDSVSLSLSLSRELPSQPDGFSSFLFPPSLSCAQKVETPLKEIGCPEETRLAYTL